MQPTSIDNGLKLVAADTTHKPVFRNLIQLYLYDMAAQSPFPLNADGLYEYDFLDRFWELPYLFYVNEEIAGFCLVISDCPIRKRSKCWFMAEFCILRPYQRKGLGNAALQMVLQRHPGDWEIAWLRDNAPAAGFWPHAIATSKAEMHEVTFDGMHWNSLSFAAP